MEIREARQSDCRQMWLWANDPTTWTGFERHRPIPWEEHVAWFTKKFKSDDCRIFIAEVDGLPIGVARFDGPGEEVTISVLIDKGQRNKGYGTNLIRLSTHEIFTTTKIQRIIAIIRHDNLVSIRAFASAKFTLIYGKPAWTGTLRRKHAD